MFGDRLINSEDRAFLEEKLVNTMPKFNVTKEEVLASDKIIFCDFWHGKDQDPRQYMEVTSMTKFI